MSDKKKDLKELEKIWPEETWQQFNINRRGRPAVYDERNKRTIPLSTPDDVVDPPRR